MKSLKPYLYLVPALAAICLILLYPLCNSFVISFQEYDLKRPDIGTPFVGLKNYLTIFRNPTFLTSLRNTVVYTLSTIALELLVAIPAALILAKKSAASNLMRTVLIMPMMLAYVVTGLMWRFLYLPREGLINTLLGFVGIHGPAWLSEPSTAMVAIVITSLWKNAPFVFLVFLAGLQSLSQDYFEAAIIDGANAWQRFWHITVPLLQPVLFIILVMRTTDAIRIFDEIYTMTGGGPGHATETMCLFAYNNGFVAFRMGYAAAVSYIMIAVTALASLMYLKLLYKKDVVA